MSTVKERRVMDGGSGGDEDGALACEPVNVRYKVTDADAFQLTAARNLVITGSMLLQRNALREIPNRGVPRCRFEIGI